MEQNFGWLQKTCRRMVIQLLDSCESDSYDRAKHGMAHSALNYYGSKFSLIPDVIPGLGYLDDFLILVTTMWVCGERELPDCPLFRNHLHPSLCSKKEYRWYR